MEQNDLLRMLREDHERLKQTETRETPPLYLPWTPRLFNPFPLASSGGVFADMPQPWAVNVLAFYATVYVNTTNTGANYWTLALTSNPGAVVLASITTSAIAANTLARLATTTITQPGATEPSMFIRATATGSPGSIFIYPSVALLRTGN